MLSNIDMLCDGYACLGQGDPKLQNLPPIAGKPCGKVLKNPCLEVLVGMVYQ